MMLAFADRIHLDRWKVCPYPSCVDLKNCILAYAELSRDTALTPDAPEVTDTDYLMIRELDVARLFSTRDGVTTIAISP